MSDKEDTSEEDPHNGAPLDNDADKRPRIWGRTATEDGEVEFTVQGGEGETSEDLKETAEETLDSLVDKQADLNGEDEDKGKKGYQ